MLNSSKLSIVVVIYFIILCVNISGYTAKHKYQCSSPNVRTVIFRRIDMDRQCWSLEEIYLLFSRRMMQELLPKRKVEAVSLLIEYFKECLLTVEKLATSKRTHKLLITVLSDTLGGYLQAFVLPMAYQAFYEGKTCYNVVQELNELHCTLKKQLRTDGNGWTKPKKVKKSKIITPLNISQISLNSDYCNLLITKYRSSEEPNMKKINLLLPFLDDTGCPTAIAVPMKDYNICGLKSHSCQNVLIKYYTISVRCLIQTYGTSSVPENGKSEVCQVQHYFNSFYQWLVCNILLRLDDNNLYPAFGSVLKIIAHLKNKVNFNQRRSNNIKNQNYLKQETLNNAKSDKKCKQCQKYDIYFKDNQRKLHIHPCFSCQCACLKNQIKYLFDVLINSLFNPSIITIVILVLIIVHLIKKLDSIALQCPRCRPPCRPRKSCCVPKQCCRTPGCQKRPKSCKRCRKKICIII